MTAKIRNAYAENTDGIFIYYFLAKYLWRALMMDASAAPSGDFTSEGAVSKYRTTARTMALSSFGSSCLAGAANRSWMGISSPCPELEWPHLPRAVECTFPAGKAIRRKYDFFLRSKYEGGLILLSCPGLQPRYELLRSIGNGWPWRKGWKLKKSEKIQDGGFQSGEDLKKYKLKHTGLSGLFTSLWFLW